MKPRNELQGELQLTFDEREKRPRRERAGVKVKVTRLDREPDVRVKPVVDAWAALYKDRFGKDYPGNDYSAGGRMIRSLPKSWSARDIIALIPIFFRRGESDRFIRETVGFKLTIFLGRLESLSRTEEAPRREIRVEELSWTEQLERLREADNEYLRRKRKA